MKKKNEKDHIAKEEKRMYSISFSIIILCFILLLFINIKEPYPKDSLTGYAVLNEDNEEETNVIRNITEKQVLDAILQAEKDMEEMIGAGFNVQWVNDTLIEAKKYFKGNYTALLKEIKELNKTETEKIKELLIKAQESLETNYSLVLEKTELISKRKEKAYELHDSIKASELRINELNNSGLLTDEISDLFNSLKNEFKNERYEESEQFLENLNNKIAEGSAEAVLLTTIYKAGKDNFVNFIKENYTLIIIILIIIIIISLLFYNRIMIRILKKKIQDNKIEKEILEELMKKNQMDYFSKGMISKDTYGIKADKYKERLEEIKRTIPVLEDKLDKFSRMKRII